MNPLAQKSGFGGVRSTAGGGGGLTASDLVVRVAQRTITHAEMLAGATPVEVVSAVAGYILIPIAWEIQKPTFAAAYVANPTYYLRYDGGSVVDLLPQLSPLLSSTQTTYRRHHASVAISWNPPQAVFVDRGLVTGNGANTTGGNAANTLRVTVWYWLVDAII
jgi:hypothetical protein